VAVHHIEDGSSTRALLESAGALETHVTASDEDPGTPAAPAGTPQDAALESALYQPTSARPGAPRSGIDPDEYEDLATSSLSDSDSSVTAAETAALQAPVLSEPASWQIGPGAPVEP
jgi:hypothetical protein